MCYFSLIIFSTVELTSFTTCCVCRELCSLQEFVTPLKNPDIDTEEQMNRSITFLKVAPVDNDDEKFLAYC